MSELDPLNAPSDLTENAAQVAAIRGGTGPSDETDPSWAEPLPRLPDETERQILQAWNQTPALERDSIDALPSLGTWAVNEDAADDTTDEDATDDTVDEDATDTVDEDATDTVDEDATDDTTDAVETAGELATRLARDVGEEVARGFVEGLATLLDERADEVPIEPPAPPPSPEDQLAQSAEAAALMAVALQQALVPLLLGAGFPQPPPPHDGTQPFPPQPTFPLPASALVPGPFPAGRAPGVLEPQQPTIATGTLTPQAAVPGSIVGLPGGATITVPGTTGMPTQPGQRFPSPTVVPPSAPPAGTAMPPGGSMLPPGGMMMAPPGGFTPQPGGFAPQPAPFTR